MRYKCNTPSSLQSTVLNSSLQNVCNASVVVGYDKFSDHLNAKVNAKLEYIIAIM